MYDYHPLILPGTRVNQTIDAPIMIFDFWELSDGFLGLMIVLIFGILFYSWGLMILLRPLFLGLDIGTIIKRRNKPGISFIGPTDTFGLNCRVDQAPRGRLQDSY